MFHMKASHQFDFCPAKQNGLRSVTYHLFLKTSPHVRCRVRVGAEDREVTAHWFGGDFTAPQCSRQPVSHTGQRLGESEG